MEYLQSKMDELLLKDLEPTEEDKTAESVQRNEGHGETGEDQDENESRAPKKTTEQPKKRGREKNELSQTKLTKFFRNKKE